MRARGGDLTAKSSVGGLIEHLFSGVGTFNFIDGETGTKSKRGYLASSFLALKGPVERFIAEVSSLEYFL